MPSRSSYNERLDLITGVHLGELTWADASQKAESLKMNKQILAAWLADISISSRRLTCRELIELVGEEVILQEREMVKAKARGQMDLPPTSGSSLDSCPLSPLTYHLHQEAHLTAVL